MAVPVNRTPRIYAAVVSAFFTLFGWPAWVAQPVAATTERIVTNYHTGLAISGFDPVAYFTASKALIGRADVETRFAGATWLFTNAGNRQAFLDNPEVYVPVFGGHDPMGVVRGVAVPGHPEVWLIVGERLYLFRDPQTREAFATRPEEFIAIARRNWPEVQRALVR